MKNIRIFIVVLLAFFVGWGGAIYYTSNGENTVREVQAVSGDGIAPHEPVLIPQIVAEQIAKGDFACPRSDLLTYEACLLYQGALGVWKRYGFADICSVTEAGAETQRALELRPEDALRAPRSPCFGYLYAMRVANVTPALISTANSAFQIFVNSEHARPGSNPHTCLQARYGMCGNQTAVGIAFFEKAGFEARAVEFYYEEKGRRLSHVIPEVLINDKWHPVDTSFGAYWLVQKRDGFRLGTLEELVAPGKVSGMQLFYNSALLPQSLDIEDITRPPHLNYLDANADILRGGKGTIKLSLLKSSGAEIFAHRPNFFGDNRMDGSHSGISYEFVNSSSAQYAITVKITGAGTNDGQPMSLCIDTQCVNFSKEEKEYRFVASSPERLYLKSDSDIAYIVAESISWERL